MDFHPPPLRYLIILAALIGGCAARPAGPPDSVPTTMPTLGGYRLLALSNDFTTTRNVSAFPVAPGIVVTCWYAVKDATPLAVFLPDGQRVTAGKVIAHDVQTDLALIQLEAPLTVPTFAKHPPRFGEKLTTVTRFGVNSATYVGPVFSYSHDVGMVFDAPGLQEGASGGAILDAEGHLLGIIMGGVNNDAHQVDGTPVDGVVRLLSSSH